MKQSSAFRTVAAIGFLAALIMLAGVRTLLADGVNTSAGVTLPIGASGSQFIAVQPSGVTQFGTTTSGTFQALASIDSTSGNITSTNGTVSAAAVAANTVTAPTVNSSNVADAIASLQNDNDTNTTNLIAAINLLNTTMGAINTNLASIGTKLGATATATATATTGSSPCYASGVPHDNGSSYYYADSYFQCTNGQWVCANGGTAGCVQMPF
jgi:hypothetical protein